MEDNSEKVYKNCEYYSQYYTKQPHSFRAVDHGHCKRLKGMPQKAPSESCGRWTDGAAGKKQRQERAKKILLHLAKQISKSAAVINHDQDD